MLTFPVYFDPVAGEVVPGIRAGRELPADGQVQPGHRLHRVLPGGHRLDPSARRHPQAPLQQGVSTHTCVGGEDGGSDGENHKGESEEA